MKKYKALVYGHLKEKSGTIELKLSKDEEKRIAYVDEKLGKNSITRYSVIEEINGYSLLDVSIDTGRFHQIRCSLSYIGHSILNDIKYNNGVEYNGFGIALDAYHIEFTHPVTKERIIIERDTDFSVFLRKD